MYMYIRPGIFHLPERGQSLVKAEGGQIRLGHGGMSLPAFRVADYLSSQAVAASRLSVVLRCVSWGPLYYHQV